MSRPLNDQPELTFEELLADPMIRLVMRVDGVEEDELRGILQRLVEQERIRGDHPRGALSSNGTENTHKLAYRSSIPAVRGSRSGLSSPRAMISGSVKA